MLVHRYPKEQYLNNQRVLFLGVIVKLILKIFFLLIFGNVFAQSKLPLCEIVGEASDACVGSIDYSNGTRYVGELKNKKKQGLGILYSHSINEVREVINWGFFFNDVHYGLRPIKEINLIESDYISRRDDLNINSNKSKGVIYVYRNQFFGNAASMHFSINQGFDFQLSGYSYRKFILRPGKYTLTNNFPTKPGLTSIDVFLEGGKNYYVNLETKYWGPVKNIFSFGSEFDIENSSLKYIETQKEFISQIENSITNLSENNSKESTITQIKDQNQVEKIKNEEAQRTQLAQDELRVAEQQTNVVNQSPIFQDSGKRIALVVGNSKYLSRPLRNPINDANDVSAALKSSGFEVIDLRDATLQQMRAGVRQFGDRLINNDVGLVYYSGHGVEVKGRNYFIPVNADIQREDEIADQGLDVSLVLEKMSTAGKGVNILIVDACRDDPFGRSFRSSSRGLANMDAPRGTIIAYATSPGKVASDGDGRNSPYTKNLVRAMQQPNKPIEQVFKEVRRAVQEETKNQQTPWENTSLSGDFYFRVQR